MINSKLKDALTDQLCEAVLALSNQEECYQFFEDICTISELKAMSQRLEVARMLREGHTYEDIVERTGASTATINCITVKGNCITTQSALYQRHQRPPGTSRRQRSQHPIHPLVAKDQLN